MMPTCGTYSAPAMPQITADSVQTNELEAERVVAENIMRGSASRIAVSTRPSLVAIIAPAAEHDADQHRAAVSQ